MNEPVSYKPQGHPVSPYIRAQQEWDSRIGSTVVQAKNWRLACLGAILLSLTLAGGLIYQGSQQKVIPVIVGLDKERGEPVVIGRSSEQAYQPGIQEIKYFLSQFVTLVRGVPQDPVLIKQNWVNAYAYLRHDAANTLNDVTNKDSESALKKIGEQTVTVQPLSVVQVTESNSFQVRWEEVVYNNHGIQIQRYIMNGVFSIELSPPDDEKTLNQNPLGLYITNFQWNREL